MDQALSPTLLRRRSRIRLAIGALFVAGACTTAWGVNRVARPSVASADIVIKEVRRGHVDNTIDAAGVVIPVHEEVVSSPGASRIAKVHAKPGQQVQAGEKLAVIEAMKMENVLFASQDGVVGAISAAKGESLAVDQIILEFV